MADIVCLGELLVDMSSQEVGVSLQDAYTFEKNPGGAPANVAVGCVSMGASAALVTKVGDDSFGRYLTSVMRDADVDTSGITTTPDYATQLAFVAIDRIGVPDFAFHVKDPAHEQLAPQEINRQLIEEAMVFHFGSLSLIAEPARSATLEAIDIAAEAGLLISFDPNYRPTLWPDDDAAYDAIAEAVELCDVLKVNENEMTLLTGTDDPYDGLRALWDMGPELVSVTLGPDGCAYTAGGSVDAIDGIEVRVVDTTGCGDAFVAATLVWLGRSDRDLSELLGAHLYDLYKHANAAGALAATHKGAIPSMPTWNDIELLLAHGPAARSDGPA